MILTFLFLSHLKAASFACAGFFVGKQVDRRVDELAILLEDSMPTLIYNKVIRATEIPWGTAHDIWEPKANLIEATLGLHEGKTTLKIFLSKKDDPDFFNRYIPRLTAQSFLATQGLARGIHKIVPSSDHSEIQKYLKKFIPTEQLKTFRSSFAVEFDFLDFDNHVIVPTSNLMPNWFFQLNRFKIKRDVSDLERKLSKLGILYNESGRFILMPDGRIVTADFDNFETPGFFPDRAGEYSSIFDEPTAQVQLMFGNLAFY